jgi:uncharacterized protein YjiS (DUF1127 family)
MMTQPIQMFENLTSETSPAGGNDIAKTTLTFEERRLLELRARYARAELVAIKADFKLRAAESQLFRMSDRELADIGLCRGDIHFAIRETAEGVMPAIDHVTHSAMPANQNLRRVA